MPSNTGILISSFSHSFLPKRSMVYLTVTQLCPTLYDPMNSTVRWILQARILEQVAIPFSRGSSQPRDRTQVSHTAGRFFAIWATREAQKAKHAPLMDDKGCPASSGLPAASWGQQPPVRANWKPSLSSTTKLSHPSACLCISAKVLVMTVDPFTCSYLSLFTSIGLRS